MIGNIDEIQLSFLFNPSVSGPTWANHHEKRHGKNLIQVQLKWNQLGPSGSAFCSHGISGLKRSAASEQLTGADARVESHQTVNSHLLRLPWGRQSQRGSSAWCFSNGVWINMNMWIYIYIHIHTLHYITLYYITLHYITLHYIALHCIALHYSTYLRTYVRTYILILGLTEIGLTPRAGYLLRELRLIAQGRELHLSPGGPELVTGGHSSVSHGFSVPFKRLKWVPQ